MGLVWMLLLANCIQRSAQTAVTAFIMELQCTLCKIRIACYNVYVCTVTEWGYIDSLDQTSVYQNDLCHIIGCNSSVNAIYIEQSV